MTRKERTRVCVVGLGYIGLPTSAVFATSGVEIIGVDVNPETVASINAGRPHIVEPLLDELLRQAIDAGNLRATTRPEAADAFILAVPTPFRDNHQPDISYVEAAARSIAPVLAAGNLVILESTSPVGTTESASRWLAEERPDLSFPHQKGDESDIRIAHCPERVLPGQIIHEVVNNARVIGGITPRCAQAAMDLYKVFVKGQCYITDAATAELAKLTENSFRDVNIAFANELSMICAKLGVNVWELIRIANLHPRVNILRPGPGVGGHCIAVDPWFIVTADPENSRLIRTAREVNDHKTHWVVGQLKAALASHTKPVIACLGLAYKADVDDLRESPAVEIVATLAAQSVGDLLIVEPYIGTLPSTLRAQNIRLVSLEEALAAAHAVLLLVDHKPFLDLDRRHLDGKVLVDTRGIW